MVSCLYNRNTRLWCVNDNGSAYSFASLSEANEFTLKCRMARKGLWFAHKEESRDSILGITGLVFSNADNKFVFVPLNITSVVYEYIHEYGSISAAYNALKPTQNQNETSA